MIWEAVRDCVEVVPLDRSRRRRAVWITGMWGSLEVGEMKSWKAGSERGRMKVDMA